MPKPQGRKVDSGSPLCAVRNDVKIQTARHSGAIRRIEPGAPLGYLKPHATRWIDWPLPAACPSSHRHSRCLLRLPGSSPGQALPPLFGFHASRGPGMTTILNSSSLRGDPKDRTRSPLDCLKPHETEWIDWPLPAACPSGHRHSRCLLRLPGSSPGQALPPLFGFHASRGSGMTTILNSSSLRGDPKDRTRSPLDCLKPHETEWIDWPLPAACPSSHRHSRCLLRLPGSSQGQALPPLFGFHAERGPE